MVDPKTQANYSRREMREERGYDSEDVVELGRIYPNPAMQPAFSFFHVYNPPRRSRRR